MTLSYSEHDYGRIENWHNVFAIGANGFVDKTNSQPCYYNKNSIKKIAEIKLISLRDEPLDDLT